MTHDLTRLSNQELVASLKKLTREEREQLVLVLRHLNEMDRRRIAIEAGFPSLFEYCVRELRYAQGEAARRIHTARAAKRFPIVYRALERGLLSLTTASILAPHLTWNNYRRLIRSAAGRSTREVEALTAALAPATPEPAERIRFIAPVSPAANPEPQSGDLFGSAPVGTSSAEAAPPREAAPDAAPARRVQISFTADETFLRDMERARQLLWHKSPAGRLELVLGEALKALLKSIDPDRRPPKAARKPIAVEDDRRKKRGHRSRPAVPRAVQDAVWRRDGGSCAFLSPDGRRCASRSGLEFDHVLPWARGGAADEDNLRLLCRAHNQFAARRAFGDRAIDAAIANSSSA